MKGEEYSPSLGQLSLGLGGRDAVSARPGAACPAVRRLRRWGCPSPRRGTSTHETAAVMRAWSAYGSYHVACEWSAPSGQLRRDTVLMVIRPTSWRRTSSTSAW